jgi:hypothetical protein
VENLSGSAIFPHIISLSRFSEIEVIDHKMCVVIFSTNLSEIFLILRMIQPDITINVLYRSSCKVPFILVRYK